MSKAFGKAFNAVPATPAVPAVPAAPKPAVAITGNPTDGTSGGLMTSVGGTGGAPNPGRRLRNPGRHDHVRSPDHGALIRASHGQSDVNRSGANRAAGSRYGQRPAQEDEHTDAPRPKATGTKEQQFAALAARTKGTNGESVDAAGNRMPFPKAFTAMIDSAKASGGSVADQGANFDAQVRANYAKESPASYADQIKAGASPEFLAAMGVKKP